MKTGRANYTSEELHVVTACADFRERVEALPPVLRDLAWQTLLGEVGAIMVPPKVAAGSVTRQAIERAASLNVIRSQKTGGRLLVNRIDVVRHLGRKRRR